jgi:hypothetical protein
MPSGHRQVTISVETRLRERSQRGATAQRICRQVCGPDVVNDRGHIEEIFVPSLPAQHQIDWVLL